MYSKENGKLITHIYGRGGRKAASAANVCACFGDVFMPFARFCSPDLLKVEYAIGVLVHFIWLLRSFVAGVKTLLAFSNRAYLTVFPLCVCACVVCTVYCCAFESNNSHRSRFDEKFFANLRNSQSVFGFFDRL